MPGGALFSSGEQPAILALLGGSIIGLATLFQTFRAGWLRGGGAKREGERRILCFVGHWGG